MKSLSILLCSALAFAVLPARAATTPDVQLVTEGRLLDANDLPVTGAHTLRFRLWASSVPVPGEDAPLWEESYDLSLTAGVYGVTLGSVDQNKAALPHAIFEANPTVYLSVAVDGGTDLLPRLAIGVAPSAFVAAVAHAIDCQGCITADQLAFDPTPADGSITTAKLAAGAVTTDKLADGAVTTTQLAPGSITTPLIAGGAVTTTQLAPGSITTPLIADGAVTTTQLAPGSITTPLIADGAVTTQLAPGSITTPLIADGAVTTTQLAPGSITTPLIADASVTTTKLAPGSITTPLIADGAVTTTQLAPGSITTPLIADESVTTAKLAPGAITTPLIADGAVTGAKVADGTLSAADFATDATGVVPGLNAATVGGQPASAFATSASVSDAVAAALSQLAGVTRPCSGGDGTQTFDGSQWSACATNAWTCVSNPNHPGCATSSQYASCKAIRADPLFGGSSGLYWISPAGGTPVQVYCDMDHDGGGWALVAWTRNGAATWTAGAPWSRYASSSSTISTTSPGVSSAIESLPTFFDNTALNVRLTYSTTSQATLDVGTNTIRAYTTTSTWKGALATVNPLPGFARNTENLNCSGLVYVDATGNKVSLGKAGGCAIEFTDESRGNWAGCGSSSYDASGGAAWNLCFDNGDATSSVGNSVLGIWYLGEPDYQEVYSLDFGTNTPPNGAWASSAGNWTWSAWVRP